MAAVVILGDPHIGKGLSSLGKPGVGSSLGSRLIDQIKILEWTLDRAVEVMASDIIITGDVFQDAKPHPTIITLFISWLKKCADSGFKVHIIMGNHELMRSGQFTMSPLDIVYAADMENIFVYKDISTIHMNGAAFTLMPFRDRRSFNVDLNSEAVKLLQDKLPYELAEIDRNSAKIVVGHLAIEGSLPVGDEISDMSNELFCSFDMFKGYDYVWMGHIHKPQVMQKTPHIAHIGSMDLSDYGETDHKKILVIFDPDAAEPVKHLEIPTRPLNQLSISVPVNITSTTDYILKEIEKSTILKNSIMKLNVIMEDQNAPSIDRAEIERSLTSRGAYHITRINEERKVSLLKKSTEEKIDNTVNEHTAIRTYAHANVDEQIRENFISLA